MQNPPLPPDAPLSPVLLPFPSSLSPSFPSFLCLVILTLVRTGVRGEGSLEALILLGSWAIWASAGAAKVATKWDAPDGHGLQCARTTYRCYGSAAVVGPKHASASAISDESGNPRLSEIRRRFLRLMLRSPRSTAPM